MERATLVTATGNRAGSHERSRCADPTRASQPTPIVYDAMRIGIVIA